MALKLRLKLDELLKDRGISLRELSRRTDVRHSALSELANQKRQRIDTGHLERIAETLGIKDVNEMIVFEVTEDE